MSKSLYRLLAVSLLLVITAPLARAAEADAGWSKVVNGLQGRLSFVKTGGYNGTPSIVTYLELRNVADLANVMEVPLKVEAIAFELHDETGRVVPPTNGSFDGIGVPLGMLRLPYDSTLRMNIASRGAGVMKDQAGLLDLGAVSNWTFPPGDRHAYALSAKFTIDKSDFRVWWGTIEIPPAPLPALSVAQGPFAATTQEATWEPRREVEFLGSVPELRGVTFTCASRSSRNW